MSYINGNNIYTSRNMNQYENKPYTKNAIQPTCYDEPNDFSDMKDSYGGQEQSGCNYTPDGGHHKPDNCHKHDDCKCNCKCSCEKPNPDCDFDCGQVNNCCKCDVPDYNPALAKPLCTYLDVICDEDKAAGSTSFIPIATGAPEYTITTQFVPLCGCTTPCTIDATSVFIIESAKVTIKHFKYTGTITTAAVLINGIPALTASNTTTGITATVDPSILKDACSDKNLGTEASVLLNALTPFELLAKFELCGKVTTGGTTCKFLITFETATTVPIDITDPLTFVAPDICLPSDESGRPLVLNADFCASAQLINPVLTGSSTAPTVTLSGNLMLNPFANVTSLQNRKVCFPGVMPNGKC